MSDIRGKPEKAVDWKVSKTARFFSALGIQSDDLIALVPGVYDFVSTKYRFGNLGKRDFRPLPATKVAWHVDALLESGEFDDLDVFFRRGVVLPESAGKLAYKLKDVDVERPPSLFIDVDGDPDGQMTDRIEEEFGLAAIRIHSGGGEHLYYGMPEGNGSQRDVLQDLHNYLGKQIDVMVYNPSRMSRIPGFTNHKRKRKVVLEQLRGHISKHVIDLSGLPAKLPTRPPHAPIRSSASPVSMPPPAAGARRYSVSVERPFDSELTLQQLVPYLRPCTRALIEHGIPDGLGGIGHIYRLSVGRELVRHGLGREASVAAFRACDDFSAEEALKQMISVKPHTPPWGCKRLWKENLVFEQLIKRAGASPCDSCPNLLTEAQREILRQAPVHHPTMIASYRALYGAKHKYIADLPSVHGEHYTWVAFQASDGTHAQSKEQLYQEFSEALEEKKRVFREEKPTDEQIKAVAGTDEEKKLKEKRTIMGRMVTQLHKQQNDGPLNSVLRALRMKSDLATLSTHYDRSPTVNCHGQVIDWGDGCCTLRRTVPEDMCMKTMACAPDPSVPIPNWLSFLNVLFQGDEEMIHFFGLLVASALTGDPQLDKLVFFHGTGENGKTILVKVLGKLFASYQFTGDYTLLMEKQSSAVRQDLARLDGVRLLQIDELPQPGRQRQMDEPLIKTFGGGGQIHCRKLFGREELSFYVRFLTFIYINTLPTMKAQEHGLWRKILVVPLLHRITEEERIPKKELLDSLMAELAGIMAWLEEKLREYLRKGLVYPEKVLVATANYRQDEDDFAPFLEECCNEVSGAQTLTTALFNAYRKFAVDTDIRHPLGRKSFARKLVEREFPSVRGRKGGARCTAGLVLKMEWGGGDAPRLPSVEKDLIGFLKTKGKLTSTLGEIVEFTVLAQSQVESILEDLRGRGEAEEVADGEWVWSGE